jgi:hypothetical protein
MAFAWMVMGAAWQLTRVRYKDRLIVLQRGQLAVSQRDMARALDRDKAWVERLWKRLRGEAMIATTCEAGVAVITICNYNEYQAEPLQREADGEAPNRAGARQPQGTEQGIEEREEDKNSASQSVARAQVREALSFWNANAVEVGWPTAQALSAKREKSIKARLRDHGMEGWRAAIARGRASPYLGREPPHWFTIDFLSSESGFLKVIEGNYDRRNSDSADPTLVALSSFGTAGVGR